MLGFNILPRQSTVYPALVLIDRATIPGLWTWCGRPSRITCKVNLIERAIAAILLFDESNISFMSSRFTN